MKNKFLIALTIFILSFNSANAVTLKFDDLLEKALDRSFDLKKANIDIDITKQDIRVAKSAYYPSLRLGANAEYNRDLTDGQYGVTQVGDIVLLNNSIYQNAASASLTYNVYDFGARKQKVIIAKKDNEIKKVLVKQTTRELKLNLANIYNEALLNYKELKAKENMLDIDNQIFSIQEKLYDAGKSSKVDVANASIRMAKLYNEIDDTKILLSRNLNDLTQLTHEDYDVNDVKLTPLEEGFIPISFLRGKVEIDEEFIKQSPEYKSYELEIEKKEAELKELKKQLLPQFIFNTNYYWYGSNRDNYFKAFSDLKQRTLAFRMSSSLPVFDGFKNSASQKRIKLEIERLKTERDDKLFQLKNYYKKVQDESYLYDDSIKQLEETILKLQDCLDMNQRLHKEQLIDYIVLLNLKEELITKKLDFEKSKINKSFSNYRLKVLSQND